MAIPSSTALANAEAVFRRHGGTLRSAEAIAAGIQPRTLYWMHEEGFLERLSWGVYHLAAHPLPEQPDVAAVVRRVPHAVVCLVSALDYHKVGTQIPAEVQIALPRGTKTPRIEFPRVRVFSMSAVSLHAGVEVAGAGGFTFNVFGIAKTVADCFKYRNRIGLDIAVEALREAIRERRTTPAEIMEFARIDRVDKVIRPYLEALA